MIMKKILTLCAFAASFVAVDAQNYQFSFDKKVKEGTPVTIEDIYSDDRGYGYDFIEVPQSVGKPFFFSVAVPDGNYKVTVTLGSSKIKGVTTVRAESRRLFWRMFRQRKES